MQMQTEKLIIIDGNSIINRAFYGVGTLTNAEGVHTNAIYGFLSVFLKYLEEQNPQYVCVAFDVKAPTFRHKSFKQYKAKRKGMPEELAMQVPILKEILNAMNVLTLQKQGYEADDIIGTVSLLCEQNDKQCIVVTGDKDALQLASDNTHIHLTVTRGGNTYTDCYDSKAVFGKYGVSPQQFIEMKGLMGDPSDNIPGVPGVGEKTALALIQEYHSIDNVYAHLAHIKGRKKIKESLQENQEMAYLSKELATINRESPIDFSFEQSMREPYERQQLLDIFKRLGFKSFIHKLQLETAADMQSNSPQAVQNHKHITNEEQLRTMIDDINKEKQMHYLIYPDYKQESGGVRCLGISFAVNCNKEPYTAYVYIHEGFTAKTVLSKLQPLFEDEIIQKIGHDIKENIVQLYHYGINLKGIAFDTMIGAYLINPSRSTYHIDEIAQEFLDVSIPSAESILGKGAKLLSMQEIEKETAVQFACRQASVLPGLFDVLGQKIAEYEQKQLYYEIELPLVEILANMQIDGFKVDKQKLMAFSKMLEDKIQTLTNKIYELAGEEFNINSPKQLGVILFEKLELPPVKKTKTGYSTSVEVLEKLKLKHPIIHLLMEYRQMVKLKSTYADGLMQVINADTGKIHSRFNQTVTLTGRISSTEPNLQNIPVKLELGREIRKMFIASDDDYVLVDADYSQIELRVLAHISQDPTMIEAFINEEDIHRKTASQVFNVSMEEVTSLMRSRAKAVNFGIVYGIGDFSLSQDLGITKKEARKYIDGYLARYSHVKQYMTDIVETAKTQGYITTLLQRRRYVPELQSKNFVMRSFGERVSMNTPIQGSAADIIKIAMVNVYRRLKEEKLKSRLILQVHDELIVEAHRDEVDRVKEIVHSEMKEALPLTVPLVVDLSAGKSWYEAKE